MASTLERAVPLDELDDRIRVVIGEDGFLMREAVEELLARADQLLVVRTCEDRDSLLRAVEEEQPHAVVTGIPMPPTGSDEGIQVAHILRETHPEIGVVVLTPVRGAALSPGAARIRARPGVPTC